MFDLAVPNFNQISNQHQQKDRYASNVFKMFLNVFKVKIKSR